MWTYSTFGNTAFAAAEHGLWNSLSSHLKEVDLSCNEFQQSLNTFFGLDNGATVQRETILIAPFRNNLTYLLTVPSSRM